MNAKIKVIPLWARVLTALASINWGLIGLCGNNILELLFSKWAFLLKAIYITIGICGVYLLATIRRNL